MDPECTIFGNPAALKLAKSNVDKFYAVVGILEQWEESLQVLEHYVPAFFKNIREAYKTKLREKPINRNNIKPQIPQYIKDTIAVNFTVEIDFYEF